MDIKRSIKYLLERRRGRDGRVIVNNCPIRVRVSFGGVYVDISTGFRIDKDDWNGSEYGVKRGRMSQSGVSSEKINDELSAIRGRIQNIFKQFEVKGVMPSKQDFKDAWESKSTFSDEKKESEDMSLQEKEAKAVSSKPRRSRHTSPHTFWAAYDEFQRACGQQNDWTEATYEKFHALEKHLRGFRRNLTFEYLTEDGLSEFVEYLRRDENMRNTTIGKQLGYLKWFLRWSLKKGLNPNNDFETFRPKLKTTQKTIIFLDRHELEKLRDFEVPEDKRYLQRVKDVFLFCCYTGIRYSDAYNLKKSDVKDNRIEFTTIKTNDHLNIELNKYSKAILAKYKPLDCGEDKALPVISNQKMNNYLKELGELAGIDTPVRQTYYQGTTRKDVISPKYELLSTHAGRRTFICNALSLGIPPQVVMKWTGHSDYKAMKPYIDIADDIKVDAMKRFDEYL